MLKIICQYIISSYEESSLYNSKMGKFNKSMKKLEIEK